MERVYANLISSGKSAKYKTIADVPEDLKEKVAALLQAMQKTE